MKWKLFRKTSKDKYVKYSQEHMDTENLKLIEELKKIGASDITIDSEDELRLKCKLGNLDITTDPIFDYTCDKIMENIVKKTQEELIKKIT
jgi:hypothetical protein